MGIFCECYYFLLANSAEIISAFTNFLRFFVQNILEFVQIFQKRREKFSGTSAKAVPYKINHAFLPFTPFAIPAQI